MAGLLTLPSVCLTVATSSAVVLRLYWADSTSCPSAWRGVITLLKQEPSAQSPWQNTMLGFPLRGFRIHFCSPFLLWLQLILKIREPPAPMAISDAAQNFRFAQRGPRMVKPSLRRRDRNTDLCCHFFQ